MVEFYKKRVIEWDGESELTFERRRAEYVYMYFFETDKMNVGHYFRHLFNILKYIHKNRWWIDTKFYAGLIQAQMSEPELFVFFYNGLTFKKVEDFINNII